MSRAAWRRIRAALIRSALPPAMAVLGRLPWRFVQRSGALLGRFAWQVSRRDRRRALEHLAIAYPELDAPSRRALARLSFRHLATTAFECLHLATRGCAEVEQHVEVEGWENVERVRRAGRPLIIVTGHCGNWELLAAVINCRGLGMSVIARRADDPELEEPILRLRSHFGTRTIHRGEPGAARHLLEALRQDRALGMLIDQDTAVKGTWVPFFGRPAYTPVGAAELAAKRDAAVVPSFIARRPDGSHRTTFHPALELPSDVDQATARMTAVIEEQIRRHPEQWVWMHRRWRRQPPDADPGG